MSPRVSVLMSVYNGGDYVRDAVNSVLQGEFGDLEFVIVDNLSTDGTRDYLTSIADPRVRPILNDRNLGQTGALNVGLRACAAPYVARLDADDLALPDRFGVQAARLEAAPKLVLLGGQAIRIDSAGKIIGATRLPAGTETIRWRMLLQNCFIHSAVMFRREAALALGGYPEDFRVSQDFALFSAMLRAGHDLDNLNRPLCKLRSHPDQVMATGGRADELGETARIAALNQAWALGEGPDDARALAITRLWYGGAAEEEGEKTPPLDKVNSLFDALPAPARQKAALLLVLVGGPCLGRARIRLALLGKALKTSPRIVFSREFYLRLLRAILPDAALSRLRGQRRPSRV